MLCKENKPVRSLLSLAQPLPGSRARRQYNLTATGDSALSNSRAAVNDTVFRAEDYAIGATLSNFRLPDNLPLNKHSCGARLDTQRCRA